MIQQQSQPEILQVVRTMSILLIIGYLSVVQASQEISLEDLQRARDDEGVQDKFDSSPLCDFLWRLVELQETDSSESQSLEREKGKQRHEVIFSHQEANSIPAQKTDERSSTPRSSQLRHQASSTTPDHKRKISETSLADHSTETTPQKLVQPEAKVQSLQNKFVDIILNKIWRGQIDISWAQGRRMFMSYAEYFPVKVSLMIGLAILPSDIHFSERGKYYLGALEPLPMAHSC